MYIDSLKVIIWPSKNMMRERVFRFKKENKDEIFVEEKIRFKFYGNVGSKYISACFESKFPFVSILVVHVQTTTC